MKTATGAWGGPENLGSTFTSDPDISSWGPDRLDIFAKGTDNGLWHKAWSNGWFAWKKAAAQPSPVAPQPFPGALVASTSSPAPAENTVMHWWYDKLFGHSGTTRRPRRQHHLRPRHLLLGTQPPRRLRQGRRRHPRAQGLGWGGDWSGWENLGGSLASGPSATSWGVNRIDVVAKAADNSSSTGFMSIRRRRRPSVSFDSQPLGESRDARLPSRR